MEQSVVEIAHSNGHDASRDGIEGRQADEFLTKVLTWYQACRRARLQRSLFVVLNNV